MEYIQRCIDSGVELTGQINEPLARVAPPPSIEAATGAALQHYLRGEEPDAGCRAGADPSMCIFTVSP